MAEPNPGFISQLKTLEKLGFFQNLHTLITKAIIFENSKNCNDV